MKKLTFSVIANKTLFQKSKKMINLYIMNFLTKVCFLCNLVYFELVYDNTVTLKFNKIFELHYFDI